MSRICPVLCALLLPLMAVSCRHATPAVPSDASHIRIEPARSPDDPLRQQPAGGVATAEEVGIAFYPGAAIEDSSLLRDDRGVTAAVRLATRDAYQDVLNFYADKYRGQAKLVKPDTAQGHEMIFNWRTPSGNFTIELKQDLTRKQTLIHLIRLTGSKAPPARKGL